MDYIINFTLPNETMTNQVRRANNAGQCKSWVSGIIRRAFDKNLDDPRVQHCAAQATHSLELLGPGLFFK
jgi:hypothetical protein